MSDISIALDAMGGDHGADIVVPAALKVLKNYKNVRLILVGKPEVLNALLAKHHAKENERLSIHAASQEVGMDESPAIALRTKKDSSMRVAINQVKEGRAQACVSAGNTGALLATARFVLKTLPGIDRPAIIRTLPTVKPHHLVRVLDLGANVDSSPENLFQFAVMGSIVAEAVDEVDNPRIGLLNIGKEDIKGNELVKKAAEHLNECDAINYTGYVEGDKIYSGVVDVVVCDGFVGNVALKVTEGTAKMMAMFIRQTFQRNIFTRLAAIITIRVLMRIREKFDPERYNGASLIGLQGIVVKSHGGAKVQAFANAIQEAICEVKKNIPLRISNKVAKLLEQRD